MSGGFNDDECSEGRERVVQYAGSCSDYTLAECEEDAQKAKGCRRGMLYGEEICHNHRTTNVEEAMIKCGNEKIVTLDDGSIWLAPEYKFRLAAQQCRDGHADGSGWAGDDMSGMDSAVGDDVNYSECLQEAYDDCLAAEPMSEQCAEAKASDDSFFWCTFCHDCENDKSYSTCFTFRETYTKAAQSCFDDNAKAGYLKCLDNARDKYNKEVLEREAICSETFVLQRASLPCTFGFVNCCCMVKGTLIEHPVDAIHTCQDRADVAQCDTWKSHGFCEKGHKYHASMIDNCRSTCELCDQSSGVKCPTNTGGSSSGSSGSSGSVPAGCDCVEGQVLADWNEYNALIIATTDKNECEMLSGKYKKGSCKAPKAAKNVDCVLATASMTTCKALGCDMIWGTKADGSSDNFLCGGEAKALL